MRSELECPICGKVNERTYYTEDGRIVEDYYKCSRCHYGYDICCSRVHEYIDINRDKRWNFELIKKAWRGEKDG